MKSMSKSKMQAQANKRGINPEMPKQPKNKANMQASKGGNMGGQNPAGKYHRSIEG